MVEKKDGKKVCYQNVCSTISQWELCFCPIFLSNIFNFLWLSRKCNNIWGSVGSEWVKITIFIFYLRFFGSAGGKKTKIAFSWPSGNFFTIIFVFCKVQSWSGKFSMKNSQKIFRKSILPENFLKCGKNRKLYTRYF